MFSSAELAVEASEEAVCMFLTLRWAFPSSVCSFPLFWFGMCSTLHSIKGPITGQKSHEAHGAHFTEKTNLVIIYFKLTYTVH